MEKFIRRKDYLTQIRTEILDLITESNDDVLDAAEMAALNELISYLAGRYDTDVMFAVVHDWSKADAYITGDRVQLISDTVWNDSDTFTNGTYIANADSTKIYRVKNSPAAGTVITDASKFDLIGDFGQLYFATVDVVAASTEIDDVDFWKSGDTRNALALRYLVDIILYEIHCRINPRNIPEHRIQRRDDAVKWLKAVSDPRNNVNPNFPEKDFGDKSGTDITWNSNEKQSHYY